MACALSLSLSVSPCCALDDDDGHDDTAFALCLRRGMRRWLGVVRWRRLLLLPAAAGAST